MLRKGRRRREEDGWSRKLRTFIETRNGALLHHRRAGVALPVRIRKDGDGPLLPVNQVFAYAVSPVHVESRSFVRRGGIELVENVIEPVLIVAAVDVIHPAEARAEVELR